MPKMDGFQVLEQIKGEERLRRLRTIILTNYDELDNETRGLKLGAIDYIRKPIHVDSLKARLTVHFNLILAHNQLEKQLQEQEVTRLGSSKPIRVNIRIISSTNRNLRLLVEEKKFREDLFYRLNVVELKVPALRERYDDIHPLARCFLEKYNRVLGRIVEDVANDVLDVFSRHEWPGNVRELQNCIESALNIVEPHERLLQKRHLPSQFEKVSGGGRRAELNLDSILKETEKSVIVRILQEEKENRGLAAKKLGISTTTLWRKMVEHGILQN